MRQAPGRPFRVPHALRLVERPLERVLALDALNGVYERSAGPGGPAAFLQRALSDLGVALVVEGAESIPESGPAVVVANHPHGILDGLALGSVLAARRPDVKLLASHLISGMPELAPMILPLDPFGGPAAASANRRSVRAALRWLEQGGLVALFPAGEVSHLDLRARQVTDPSWSLLAAWLARHGKAPVVPAFLAGRNSALFQLAGFVHPRLRTALLPRELFRKRRSTLTVRVGRAIAPDRLAEWPRDDDATAAFRQRTYREGGPSAARRPPEPPGGGFFPGAGALRSLLAGRATTQAPPAQEAIHPPLDPAALAAEVATLPPRAVLLESADHAVCLARAQEIPTVLREIGRLREVTFRAVGEGTGRALDLDRFDEDYLHLFVWSRSRRAVIGAYRIGPTDELGAGGMYTATLFRYDRRLLDRLGPALELGRAFVRPEDQRTHAPLGLLWRGIGRFVAANPRYRRLYGPVSVSARMREGSRRLILAHLETRKDEELAALVRPLRPPATGPLPVEPVDLADPDAVSDLISGLEPDGAGLPVLVRQYVRLGAKFLTASVDPDFGHSVDGLVVLDLLAADRRLLARTLGKAEAAALLAAAGSSVEPKELRRAG